MLPSEDNPAPVEYQICWLGVSSILNNKASTKIPKTLNAVGEVISSSITDFVTELWSKDKDGAEIEMLRPNFGSFLRVESVEDGLNCYAVVVNIITGPYDAQHKPTAMGLSRQELRVEQPHIFSLLQTQIQASLIGFEQDGQMHLYLPPKPPQVHDFVFLAEKEEVQRLTEDLGFLRLLTNVISVPTDELLAAAIRQARHAHDDDTFLVDAGKALSHLIRDDYDRLVSLLKKIRPF